MKLSLVLLVVLVPFMLHSQTVDEAVSALKTLTGPDQGEDLRKKYPDWEIYQPNLFQSDSTLFANMLKAAPGEIVVVERRAPMPKVVFKVLGEKKIELCKVKYIYLDGRIYSKPQIDSIRSKIISAYKAGENFSDLAARYTMDGNVGGDLDWFAEGLMVPEFDQPVRKRRRFEIFTVDVDRNQWYYVVLKTDDNKVETAKACLQVECKD